VEVRAVIFGTQHLDLECETLRVGGFDSSVAFTPTARCQRQVHRTGVPVRYPLTQPAAKLYFRQLTTLYSVAFGRMAAQWPQEHIECRVLLMISFIRMHRTYSPLHEWLHEVAFPIQTTVICYQQGGKEDLQKAVEDNPTAGRQG